MTKLILLLGLASASPTLWAAVWKPATDCRANIAAVTCRVHSKNQEISRDPREVRKCLGGESPYVAELVKVHNELPPKLQKMFCHLRKIYVEENFYGTGYAAHFAEVVRGRDGKEQVAVAGNVLGLSRQKAFESRYGLSEWLNRKEQTLFGRKMEDPLLPEIPQLNYEFVGVKSNHLLMDVIIHEFGHMLDFSQGFVSERHNSNLECEEKGSEKIPSCRPQLVGAWPAIGWEHDGSIRSSDRYFGDYRPCYYKCAPEYLPPPSQAADIYRGFIATSSFVSLYASVNPWEDFAESFLFFIASKYLSPGDDQKYFSVGIQFPGESEIFNLSNLAQKGRIPDKMNFMMNFDLMPWTYSPKRVLVPIGSFVKQPELNRAACY